MGKKRIGESLTDMFKKETNSKELNSQSSKASKTKRKHTIYLSSRQSKKLRLYAAQNDITLSQVIEELIDKNL